MRKASSAETDRVAALEGTARQGGASSVGETTLSLCSNAATGNNSSRSFGGPVSRRAVDNRSVSRADGQETVTPTDHKSSLGLWLWVAGAFLLLVVAWTVMFTAARSAKIESVPRTTKGGR